LRHASDRRLQWQAAELELALADYRQSLRAVVDALRCTPEDAEVGTHSELRLGRSEGQPKRRP
jgi:hypothetical protein